MQATDNDYGLAFLLVYRE